MVLETDRHGDGSSSHPLAASHDDHLGAAFCRARREAGRPEPCAVLSADAHGVEPLRLGVAPSRPRAGGAPGAQHLEVHCADRDERGAAGGRVRLEARDVQLLLKRGLQRDFGKAALRRLLKVGRAARLVGARVNLAEGADGEVGKTLRRVGRKLPRGPAWARREGGGVDELRTQRIPATSGCRRGRQRARDEPRQAGRDVQPPAGHELEGCARGRLALRVGPPHRQAGH
mmetsp:Transcript_97434/g.303442  ORF Transcript_97434/g.303442 Transcript_97434/m.303442 type:complete len:230 (-) Transcript_97434:1026-1715(-)